MLNKSSDKKGELIITKKGMQLFAGLVLLLIFLPIGINIVVSITLSELNIPVGRYGNYAMDTTAMIIGMCLIFYVGMMICKIIPESQIEKYFKFVEKKSDDSVVPEEAK